MKKVKVQIGIFESTGIMSQDLVHPYYWRAKRANLVVLCARFFSLYYWRAGASQLNRTTGTIFLVYIYIYIYIYIYHGQCHTANRLRVSKLTQLTIFHRSSPRVYRHIHSSRRCTVATVQDEANPSSSQPAASCCVASESTEAHRDGWREYVLAEESVLPRKQPKRKRGV